MAEEGRLEGIFAQGYGLIPKLIMRDKDLTPEAKAIYCYLASFTGAGRTAYPSVSLMASELNMGVDRFYRHRKQLVEKDYIRISRHKNEGEWSNNVYTLTSKPYPQNKDTQNKDTQNKDTQNEGTIINSSIINSINNNSTNKDSRNSGKPKYADDSPYMKLARRLFDHLKQRNPEQSEPNWQTWADDFRKTVELDKKSLENVFKVLDWSQQNEFWKNNVMSPAKFRKQYDQLYLKMNEEFGMKGGQSYGGLEF